MEYAIFISPSNAVVRKELTRDMQSCGSYDIGGFPMEDNRNQVENTLSDQAKVISLFQFIQELNKLKQKAILNVKDYPWSFSLSDLPNDPENISLHYQDRVSDDLDSEKAEDGNLILSVHKPEF